MNVGDGYDVIYESAGTSTYGTDTIHITGVDPASVRMWNPSSVGNLMIYSGGDALTIAGALSGASGTAYETIVGQIIERVTFDDNTVWDLAAGLTLTGTNSAETGYAGSGADTMYGLDGNDTLYGNRGNDILYGGNDSDTLYGGADNDALYGGAGTDYLYGNDGNDTLAGGLGTDYLYGGAGNDTYVYTLGDGFDIISEDLSGGTDQLILTDLVLADIRIWTWSTGEVTVYAPVSGLQINAGLTGYGTSEINALGRIEEIVFSDSTVLDLRNGLVITGTNNATGTETAYGTSGHDTMYGLGGSDILYGNRGNDFLYGGDGTDTLYGGDGNDTLSGGLGHDRLYGGAGDDTYLFSAGDYYDIVAEDVSGGFDTVKFTDLLPTDVRLFTWSMGELSIWTTNGIVEVTAGTTGYGTSEINASGRIDQIIFSDNTVWSLNAGLAITGSSSGESAYGTAYNDTMYGLEGADTLYGNRGNDTLYGGDGNDILYGGDGNDTLYGGAGADTLNGGAGSDTFTFDAATAYGAIDTIADFSLANNDKLDLSDLLSAYDPLLHAITDFVEITTSGSNSIVKVDADGGGNSFVQIATLSNATGLTDEAALVSSGNLIVS